MCKFIIDPWAWIALELTVLYRKQLRHQEWRYKPGKSSQSIFPSAASGIQQLKYLRRKELPPQLTGKQLRILRKRGVIPSFCRGYGETISLLYRRVQYENSKIPKNRGVWKYKQVLKPHKGQGLKNLLKEAKNLKSLIVETECTLPNFKEIRRARCLQNLDLTIEGNQILAYPQLFKRLLALQKIKLYVRSWLSSSENLMIQKFFRIIVNLPKLQHLTVWFNQGEEYKALLSAIGAKNRVPSFHVIANNPFQLEGPNISWGQAIDTLYLGPIPYFENQDRVGAWLPIKQERRLSLGMIPEIEEVISEGMTIKNLEIVDLIWISPSGYNLYGKKLFEIRSQLKTLENLTLEFGKKYSVNNLIEDFIEKFSEIEPPENLTTLTFSLVQNKDFPLKILPPYGAKMKNLKTLSLDIASDGFDVSSFLTGLKDLIALENFNFKFMESGKSELSSECSFPLENLNSITMSCNIPFSAILRDQLVEDISKAKNLESLKIEGQIFDGLERKKACGLIGDLCLKSDLKFASFDWKETGSLSWNQVNMRKLNGEMIVSSGYKRLSKEMSQ